MDRDLKTAIITANIGGIDEVYPPVTQSEDYELFYWTENTLPFPLPNLDNRMKGKYFKTQAHRFLDHDIFIWCDSSIDITNPDFVKTCIEKLEGNDIVIEKHSQRKNVYDEIVYIIDKMKAGDRYLLKRYAKQPLYQEFDFYKREGLPNDYPLFNCSFFARHNHKQCNKIFDDWWDYIMRYSNFDQTQFSFAAWKNKAKIADIETEDLFIRTKHIGYNL